MPQRHKKFGEWLFALKLIDPDVLNAALASQAEDSRYIGEILLEQEAISEAVRDAVLALQKLLLSSTRLIDMQPLPEVLKLIPPRYARDNSVLPLMRVADCLVVAMPSAQETDLLEELQGLTDCHIYPLPYRETDILLASQRAYDPRKAQQNGMEWIHDELPLSGPLLTVVGSGDAMGSGARSQTCLHLLSSESVFLIDCGPTTLTSMKQMGLDPARLDGMMLTHGHGDHFGGVPFVLLDLIDKGRTRPFWIMGTPEVLERVSAWNDLAYGALFEDLPFELLELPLEQEPRSVPQTGIMVYPFNMNHKRSERCLGLQVHLPEEKIIAYTGDTAWCDGLEMLARDTDLLICECSFYEAPDDEVKHLSYREIMDKRDRLNTRQLVLTHMGEEMLKQVAQGQVDCEVAYDGLTIELPTRD